MGECRNLPLGNSVQPPSRWSVTAPDVGAVHSDLPHSACSVDGEEQLAAERPHRHYLSQVMSSGEHAPHDTMGWEGHFTCGLPPGYTKPQFNKRENIWQMWNDTLQNTWLVLLKTVKSSETRKSETGTAQRCLRMCDSKCNGIQDGILKQKEAKTQEIWVNYGLYLIIMYKHWPIMSKYCDKRIIHVVKC